MVSSELGACEWFVWDLRRSGLIDRGQLDQVIGEFLKRQPRAEPPALAEYLVQQNILSSFQAERILLGKTQGLVLGPYVLIDSIGSGSMGQVYKATSKTDNQLYAVKVLPRRSMWNVRLARRQVRSFSQFSHPGVVPFVDVGTSGGLHYLVWPFVEGETLESKVQREGKLAPAAVIKFGLQIAQALSICHQNGIFHGLIKPSNIMMGRDGEIRLLDFGIGSLLAENEGESLVDTMSTANTLTSGLDCSSPESIMEPTNRTPAGDQYSLGCVLYFAVAGHYPFPEGTAVEKMMAHQFKQPVALNELSSTIPAALTAIVDRLLQKAPTARYNSIDELVEAFHALTPETAIPGSSYGYSHPKAINAVASGSPRAVTPIPGQGGLPLPQMPKPFVQSAPTIAATGTSRSGDGSKFGTSSAVPSAPAKPSASDSFKSSQKSQPQSRLEKAIPTAHIVDDSPAKPTHAEAVAPGWVPEEQTSKSTLGPLMIVGIAAIVTILVYLLGKNFLFPTY